MHKISPFLEIWFLKFAWYVETHVLMRKH